MIDPKIVEREERKILNNVNPNKWLLLRLPEINEQRAELQKNIIKQKVKHGPMAAMTERLKKLTTEQLKIENMEKQQ